MLLRLLGPVARPGDLEEVRPVGQAIQGGRGEQGFAEEVGPLGRMAVTREQDRRPFVPLVDDVVQVLGAGRPEGLQVSTPV